MADFNDAKIQSFLNTETGGGLDELNYCPECNSPVRDEIVKQDMAGAKQVTRCTNPQCGYTNDVQEQLRRSGRDFSVR